MFPDHLALRARGCGYARLLEQQIAGVSLVTSLRRLYVLAVAAAVLPACLIISVQFSWQYIFTCDNSNENVEFVYRHYRMLYRLFKNKILHQLSAQYPQTYTCSVRRGLALQHFALIALLICTTAADAHSPYSPPSSKTTKSQQPLV